jgi:CRP-like cAMP-binding protein
LNLLHNGLVAQLSPADQTLLQRRCKPVNLAAGEVLSGPGSPNGHIHFLTSGSVALVVCSGGQTGLAVGLAGREGAVGLQFALGLGAGNLTLLVQSGGTAFRADGIALQRLSGRRSTMLLAFSRYLWLFSQEVAMLAAAAQIQDIKARLASWILLSGARAPDAELHLTHAHLAAMLGVRRAGVTLAAMELKERGLVDYRRGRIHILDLAGLQAAALQVAALPSDATGTPI